MPRHLILALFCGAIASAFIAGSTLALANNDNDSANNFRQPNLKPYENLASVLKASYKKTTNTNSSAVTKKASSTYKSKSAKGTSSTSKSSLNKTKANKSSHSASNYKKKNNQKSKSKKKST